MDTLSKVIDAMPQKFQIYALGTVLGTSAIWYLWRHHYSRSAMLEQKKRELEVLKTAMEIYKLQEKEVPPELVETTLTSLRSISDCVWVNPREKTHGPQKLYSRLLAGAACWSWGAWGGVIWGIILFLEALRKVSPTQTDLPVLLSLCGIMTVIASILSGLLGCIPLWSTRLERFFAGLWLAPISIPLIARLLGWMLSVYAAYRNAMLNHP